MSSPCPHPTPPRAPVHKEREEGGEERHRDKEDGDGGGGGGEKDRQEGLSRLEGSGGADINTGTKGLL